MAGTMSAEGRRALAGKHVLIADQFNNRVIEVNASGEILWHFGLGPSDVSARSIVGVNDAERVFGDLTLMAGTGAPPGTEPLCPTGCADNRVILVDGRGRIVWQYGQFGVTGAGPNQLSSPVQSTYLPDGHILITDQGNARVIEVTRHHHIVFQYGQTGVPGIAPGQLNNPNSAELLENGHILISDESNNRAIEVTRGGTIVATFTGGGTFSGVAFASRLEDGHTLITDSNNNRIVEVDANDAIVWADTTNLQTGSNANPLPTRAVRLANGTTLISDQFNHRVILVDHAKHILAQFGTLNTPGFGTDDTKPGLNAPYDAKVIGDFTGLTPPGHRGDREGEGDDD
jgi:outer membrane protein assembly factor BamB